MRYAFALIALCLATPAESRVIVGLGIPFFLPPPVYYPPPVYPPAYYGGPPYYDYRVIVTSPPPQGYYGRGECDAGPYVCPLDRPYPIGSNCYCIGNEGQRAWGRAN